MQPEIKLNFIFRFLRVSLWFNKSVRLELTWDSTFPIDFEKYCIIYMSQWMIERKVDEPHSTYLEYVNMCVLANLYFYVYICVFMLYVFQTNQKSTRSMQIMILIKIMIKKYYCGKSQLLS